MTTKALQLRVDELEKIVSSLSKTISIIEVSKETTIPDVKKDEDSKKSKGLKKDGTPRKKRGTSGYLLFSNDKRSEARSNLLEEANGEKISPGAVVKKLAELWNALTPEEKEPYNSKAKTINEEVNDVDIE